MASRAVGLRAKEARSGRPSDAPFPALEVVQKAPAQRSHPSPTGIERTFGMEDVLVSKTDLLGHITYANPVFQRVAGYSEPELIGQPHSIIRHPAMPRCVFSVMWEVLQRGEEIFAYVINLAKTGDHYWVFAHVSPTFDSNGTIVGYHSTRRCPDPVGVDRSARLYEKLLAVEGAQARKADAITAARRVLEQTLADAQLTYEQFVFLEWAKVK